MSDVDLVIAGGGPVGLVTGIAARRAGLSALVIERSVHLPEKACGEGLMPGAVSALGQLGVELPDSVEFQGITFIDGTHHVAATFPAARGRAMSRSGLMRCLDARARALGVEIWSGHAVREFDYRSAVVRVTAVSRGTGQRSVRGRLLVAADGLRSPIRRQLGYELPPRYPPRFGVARHFNCPPWSRSVEVYWHECAEAYVTPLGPEEVGVAVLTHGSPLAHQDALKLFPRLERQLARAQGCGRARGAGPFEQRVKSVLAPGVAFVGDAAGYLDAISGEGMSLGFRSAVALVERFSQGELWRYPRDHADLGRAYFALTHFMLALSRSPRLRRHVLRWMARAPDVLSDLIGIAADGASVPASRLGALLRFCLAATASSGPT